MNEIFANQVGGRQGIIGVIIGLLIIYLVMAWVTSDFPHALIWFLDVDYKLNILIGVVITFIVGFVAGKSAGRAVLIKNRNAYLSGLGYGFITLLASVVLSSLTGFFREGFHNDDGLAEAAYDYIFRPSLRMIIIGIVPATFAGCWLGFRIKTRALMFRKTGS